FLNSYGALSFTFGNGQSPRVRVDSIGPRINDGQWHLVGVVFTRSDNGVLYVDGAPAVGGAGSIANQSGNIDNSVPLRFGVEDQTGNQNFYFSGAIDEVRIYSRSLSQQEITDLYNPAAPPSQPVHGPVTAELLGQTGEDVLGQYSAGSDGVLDVHIR